ncbi:hypothetical protein STEG23_016395, partial [Scotinomys teguina]
MVVVVVVVVVVVMLPPVQNDLFLKAHSRSTCKDTTAPELCHWLAAKALPSEPQGDRRFNHNRSQMRDSGT